MKEYRVISGSCIEYLELHVSQQLALDWKLQGGVAISAANDRDDYFYQAMWREKPDVGGGQ